MGTVCFLFFTNMGLKWYLWRQFLFPSNEYETVSVSINRRKRNTRKYALQKIKCQVLQYYGSQNCWNKTLGTFLQGLYCNTSSLNQMTINKMFIMSTVENIQKLFFSKLWKKRRDIKVIWHQFQFYPSKDKSLSSIALLITMMTSFSFTRAA